jgi:zinc finger protein
MVESTKEPAYQEMDPNKDIKQIVIDLENGVPSDEIESLCMDCKEQGITRFMYTKIPMFKEIILSSFHCEHCGNKNTEVQFGGKLAGQGVRYTYTVTDEQALNRSIVKSEYATIRIPELDFEILSIYFRAY